MTNSTPRLKDLNLMLTQLSKLVGSKTPLQIKWVSGDGLNMRVYVSKLNLREGKEDNTIVANLDVTLATLIVQALEANSYRNQPATQIYEFFLDWAFSHSIERFPVGIATVVTKFKIPLYSYILYPTGLKIKDIEGYVDTLRQEDMFGLTLDIGEYIYEYSRAAALTILGEIK